MDKAYEGFLNYLEEQGIIKSDIPIKGMKNKHKRYEEKEIIDQLRVISEFSNKVMGYRGYKSTGLDNKTGRIVEEYKVKMKKFKREIRNIKLNSPSNGFEELMLEFGPKYLERSESCIDQIYNFGYLDLLKRSMHRSEICLGDTDFSNIRKNKEIEVWSFKHCSYNMVEMDGFYLLNKFKRKGVSLDYHKLCNSFCGFQKLDIESEKYILALLSYPYEFIKCYERYIEDKEKYNDEMHKANLINAIEKDIKSLI